jgi:hypothetical protein
VLTALALQFQGDTRHQLLQQALDAARTLADAQDQETYSSPWHPTYTKISSAGARCRSHIRSERYQADVFIALASHLHVTSSSKPSMPLVSWR